jgi:hypothetical protein
MATVQQEIRECDVVQLLDSIAGWPAGTVGAVVDEVDDWKQIEIADDRGQTLDLVSVSAPRLKLITKHSA